MMEEFRELENGLGKWAYFLKPRPKAVQNLPIQIVSMILDTCKCKEKLNKKKPQQVAFFFLHVNLIYFGLVLWNKTTKKLLDSSFDGFFACFTIIQVSEIIETIKLSRFLTSQNYKLSI